MCWGGAGAGWRNVVSRLEPGHPKTADRTARPGRPVRLRRVEGSLHAVRDQDTARAPDLGRDSATLWLAADELPLFESAWNWDHFYPLTGDMARAELRGLDHARRHGTRDAADQDRLPGHRHDLPAPGGAGQHGRHRGPSSPAAASSLGIGAGWNQMECDAYGIPLPPLKERFDRFDEGVEAMVMLLTEPVSNFPGQYFTLTDARCEPKPVQRPYPPITIGGTGRRRTLRTTARWAQQWNSLGRGGVAESLELKDVLRGHCADHRPRLLRDHLLGQRALDEATSTSCSRTPPPGGTRAWTWHRRPAAARQAGTARAAGRGTRPARVVRTAVFPSRTGAS